MKRRNFLKAIGLGALVAPAVVMAKEERIKPAVYIVGDGTIETDGYFEKGDGGGGLYRWEMIDVKKEYNI